MIFLKIKVCAAIFTFLFGHPTTNDKKLCHNGMNLPNPNFPQGLAG